MADDPTRVWHGVSAVYRLTHSLFVNLGSAYDLALLVLHAASSPAKEAGAVARPA